MAETVRKVLSIAGSDSGGGAGIQADLRTFAVLGCHGSSAVTAITAQNSLGVQSVHPLPPEVVGAQMRSVLSDIGADAAKTGMLFSAGIIEEVARCLDEYPVKRLVVDPVMVAKGGANLLEAAARRALADLVLPKALLLTPNLPEAEALTGFPVTDAASREEACCRLLALGPHAVLLKGGHSEGNLVADLYVDHDGGRMELTAPRLDTMHTHGTGCTLSAAAAAYLARGERLRDAVRLAHGFLQRALRQGYPAGAGHGSTNPYAAAMGGGERGLLERLWKAWDILEEANPVGLLPEVQSNLAEALPEPRGFDGVAAFPGRIVRCGARMRRVDGPRFGASRHMAKILLASARNGSPFRAVMNVRYGTDVLAACRAEGFSVEGFSRDDEPADVKAAEGSTLEWGTGWVLATKGYAPDVIYDEGDRGKEPMIRVFGNDAVEVAHRVAAIWRRLERG